MLYFWNVLFIAFLFFILFFCAKGGESNFGCERLRQDLRRRHVSAGVVLGMNRHHQAGTSSAVRTQTTLNSAVPLWGGNDPLAQEIEGLLDSASSNVNDSVLNRSQSVPIHQMFQQFHYQGMQSGPTQSYSSISQPSTPFEIETSAVSFRQVSRMNTNDSVKLRLAGVSDLLAKVGSISSSIMACAYIHAS